MRVLIVSVMLAGCAGINPPELASDNVTSGGDPEHRLCQGGVGDGALAACARILARPDPDMLPSPTGSHHAMNAAVLETRGDAAVIQVRRLLEVQREAEARAVLAKAVSLYERAAALLVYGWARDDPQRRADPSIARVRRKAATFKTISERIGPLRL